VGVPIPLTHTHSSSSISRNAAHQNSSSNDGGNGIYSAPMSSLSPGELGDYSDRAFVIGDDSQSGLFDLSLDVSSTHYCHYYHYDSCGIVVDCVHKEST
jgi:hypothetical protein